MREGQHEDSGFVLRIVTTDDGYVYVEMEKRHDTQQVFTSGKIEKSRFLRLLHQSGVL